MHSCSTLLYDSFSIIRKIWTQTPELNTVSKGKTRVSTGFFYIFMALEIVIEIEPGSKWHSPWVSKHPPLPTTALWPSYSSCHWNSFMTLTFLLEKTSVVHPCTWMTHSLLSNVNISLEFYPKGNHYRFSSVAKSVTASVDSHTITSWCGLRHRSIKWMFASSIILKCSSALWFWTECKRECLQVPR